MWQSRPYIFQVRCHLTQKILYLLVMCNVDGLKQQFTGSLKVFLWTVCRDGWSSGIWTLGPRPQLVPGSAVHFPLLGWTQRCDCRSSVLLGPVEGRGLWAIWVSAVFILDFFFSFFLFLLFLYSFLSQHGLHLLSALTSYPYHNVDNEIK